MIFYLKHCLNQQKRTLLNKKKIKYKNDKI